MRSNPSDPTVSVTPAAVVVGGDLGALGVSRSLIKGGVPTYVLEHRRSRAAMWSRHVTAIHIKANHGQKLLGALHSLGNGLTHRPFMIVSDESALLTISQSRKELHREFRIQLPEHETVITLQNKALFHEFAVANGLPVPRGLVIRDVADIKRIHELNFPTVIKPADKRFVHQGAVRRLVVAADWRKAEKSSRSLIDMTGEIIVQERIGGPENRIYFTLFYCGADRIPIMFTGRKLGEGRPGMGSTVCCTGASPQITEKLEELTRVFIEGTGYAGFGSVEYKLDSRSRKFVIIEPTVGRVDWQEEIATLAGVNLPLAAYCREFGLPYENGPRPERVVWQSSWIDRLRGAVVSIPANSVVVDGYWRPDDPVPALVHYSWDLVRSGHRIIGALVRGLRRRLGRWGVRGPARAPIGVVGSALLAMLCVGWATSSHPGDGSPSTDSPGSPRGGLNALHTLVTPLLPAAVETYSPPSAPSAGASAAGSDSFAAGSDSFEVGDKLKIVFYERVVDTEGNKWARVGAPPLGFEQRSEFTGDYTIGDHGMLSLPLLGSVRAADLSEQQLEAALAKSFKSLTGHEAVVSILSIARPGIYVLGPVKNPGSYGYVPGMTVLHAIALAGGFAAGGNASWERVEAVQEYDKRRGAIEDLPTLMAQRAVLQAERDGGDARPPAGLLDLVGDATAKQLIANEVHRRAGLDAARGTEDRALADALQSARQQVQTEWQTLGTMNTLIKMRAQRADGLKSLAAKGNINNLYLLQAQSDLTDAEQRRQDGGVKYAEAQQRLTQIEEEQAKLAADEKHDSDSSISSIEQQITASEREIAASNSVLGALNVSGGDPQYAEASSATQGSSLEIVRRMPNGPMSLPATEMTTLRPGDLIRIRAGAQPALDGGDHKTLIKAKAPEPSPPGAVMETRAAR